MAQRCRKNNGGGGGTQILQILGGGRNHFLKVKNQKNLTASTNL